MGLITADAPSCTFLWSQCSIASTSAAEGRVGSTPRRAHYLFAVLFCSSPTTRDPKRLSSVCLSSIWVSSEVKCLLKVFPLFSLRLFLFHLWNLKDSLCILIVTWPSMPAANVFFLSVLSFHFLDWLSQDRLLQFVWSLAPLLPLFGTSSVLHPTRSWLLCCPCRFSPLFPSRPPRVLHFVLKFMVLLENYL